MLLSCFAAQMERLFSVQRGSGILRMRALASRDAFGSRPKNQGPKFYAVQFCRRHSRNGSDSGSGGEGRLSMAQEKRIHRSLPSLPQVLVRVLDALYDDQTDLPKLSSIILKDAGMSARIISVANSSFYYRGRRQDSLERAVLHLGSNTVKTLVMTAAMQELFSRYNKHDPALLKHFWRSALATAGLGQALAVLTSYSRPEEAYLTGLMVNIGRLIRLDEDPERYRSIIAEAADGQGLIQLEQQTYGSSHCDIAAGAMAEWGLSCLAADSVRYHLESAAQIQDTPHLVKIVNLAYAMGQPGAVADDTLIAADMLFGLNEGLTKELRTHAADNVAEIAQSLGIEVGAAEAGEADSAARHSLAERLDGLNQLARLQGELAELGQSVRPQQAVERALFLTFAIRRSLLFLFDDERLFLRAWRDGAPDPDFLLPLQRGHSVIVDAVLDGRPTKVTEADLERVSVADRQAFNICASDSFWVQPLQWQQKMIGAAVLGISTEQLAELENRRGFVAAMGREIAHALTVAERCADDPGTDQPDLEQHIREMVHEANNPLGVIQNYLAILRVKLGAEHAAQPEIEAIRQEIERVGRILMRMRETPPDTGTAPVSLNHEVRQITDIFSASVCAARGIILEVKLAPTDPPLAQSSDHLRQVLTNLLKNATEAVDEKGRILVSVRDPVTVNGKLYSEIRVQDNGPGLPRKVLENLFSPVESSKGPGHSGLGLSIVKRLVDKMDAVIMCSSSPEGTQFLVLLPRAPTL